MTDTNQQQIDRLVDRLVDGELTDVERGRLLESFEQDADGWRRCACAFLEAQEFGTALGGFDANSAQAAVGSDVRDLHAIHESTDQKTTGREHGHHRVSNVRWWAALAACLAIGVAIGQLDTAGVDSPQPIVASDSARPAPEVTNPMIASDTNLSPTFAGQSLNQHVSVVPDDIEDILGRLGHRVERRRIYSPVSSMDAQALPVEEIEIVPVRWDTY